MIKFAEINITYRKVDFSRVIYFNKGDNIKNDIEYEVRDLIAAIAKLSYIPKYFISKILYSKRHSIRVNIYTMNSIDNVDEPLCIEKLNQFNNNAFCDNESLASFIIESYSNGGFSKRSLAFGNLNYYWRFRRELSDYNLRNSFYKVGDIVLIDGYKDPFIITWRNENTDNYDFSNTYDVYCIKNNKIQFTEDDGIHYNHISKVIGHDLDLAKIIIMVNKSEYTEEYVNKIMAMKE